MFKPRTIIIGLTALVLITAPTAASAFQLIPSGCLGDASPEQCGLDELFQVFINFANFLLSIIGSVVLAMFVFGGFTWLTSGGSADKVKKGRDIMVNTVVGLVIVLIAATVVYSIGTALCRGNQSCIRSLNIYSASDDVVAGGVDCRKEENDGKKCGTEKNYKCSYELRKCVTACEADTNLQAQNYSCTNIPLSEVNETTARAYAERYECRIGLCPGDWNNICCPPHTAVTTCCECQIREGSDLYTTYFLSDGTTCNAQCNGLKNVRGGDSYDILPNITREDDMPGCNELLNESGL